MASLVPSKKIETILRQILKKEGYRLNKARKYGETGADIIAKKGKKNLFIEVISFKSNPPHRSKDFYQVFFRAISRLDQGAKLCVIALPIRFKQGIPYRVRQYYTAWKRIGSAFPELEIWLIDDCKRTYQKTRWRDWVKAI